MEHQVVYRNPQTYSHNPDVARLANGELVMVFREAPRRRRCTHIDPESQATLLRSADGGRSWDKEAPVVAAKGPRHVGIQDPSVAALRDGRLICNFFTWDAPPDAPYGAECLGTFAVGSADGGRTWDRKHTIVDLSGRPGVYSATTDAVLELPSGHLLMPLYDNKRARNGYGVRSLCFRSTDAGKSWHQWGTMAEDMLGNVDLCEPAIAALPSGKLVAMLREERKKECLWQTESVDHGESWSLPRRTPIWGFPADLLPLASGKLLCTYGYRRRPFGVRACLSHDEGRTWDIQNELILRNDGVGPDVGYPSSLQLDDGTIFTAYYLSDQTVEEASERVAGAAGASGGSGGSGVSESDDPASHFGDGGTRYIAGSFYREW